MTGSSRMISARAPTRTAATCSPGEPVGQLDVGGDQHLGGAEVDGLEVGDRVDLGTVSSRSRSRST